MSHQQIQIVPIPPTTAQTVVFPQPYNTDSYSPELTDNQVSSEEINQFFSKLQPVLAASHAEFSFGLMFWIKLYVYPLIWLVPSLIGYLKGMLYLDDYIDMTWQERAYCSLIFPEYCVLCATWYVRNESVFGSSQIFSLSAKCQDIVDEENASLRSRGLKWSLPAQFPKWIELTKDLEKRANEFQVETEEKITFHRNIGGYSKDYYSPEMTDGRVSHEEMYQMISKINPIIRKPIARPCYRWYALALFCDVWILPLIEINKHLPNLLSYFQISLLVLVFLLLTVVLVNRVGRIDEKMFKVRSRTRLQGLISKFNETLRGRGLRWSLPTQFPNSIELCKDYNNQNSGRQEHDSLIGNKNDNRRFRNNDYVPLLEDQD